MKARKQAKQATPTCRARPRRGRKLNIRVYGPLIEQGTLAPDRRLDEGWGTGGGR